MATTSTVLPGAIPHTQDNRSASLWRVALRRLFRRRSSIAGMIILGFLTLIAVLTIAQDILQVQIITPFKPGDDFIDAQNVKQRETPCIHLLGCPADKPEHIMGIDANYRDLFTRVLYGARVSLIVGLVSVSLAIVIGTLVGSVAGYAGGWVDIGLMRVMDVLLAFPSLILAIAT